jgi:hypothetical protein
MSKRSRLPKTYDYTFGAFEVPEAKATGDFVSSLVPRAIVIGGLGALAYWLFFSPKAAAKENAKSAALPTGSETGGSVTTAVGVKPATFVDPGSNVAIAGPAGPIVLSNDRHIVKAGESWSNLASRAYGDYRWWPALWDANRSLGRFGNPSTLAVGDVVVIPKLPLESTRFKKLVFARAEVDRAWELKKLKKGAKVAGPRPKEVFVSTPILATDVPAPAAPVLMPTVTEPVPEQPQEAVRQVDYTTPVDPAAPAEDSTVEDLSLQRDRMRSDLDSR